MSTTDPTNIAARRLATSARPMVEVLIDAMRRTGPPLADDEDEGRGQLALALDPEDDGHDATAYISPSLDEIAAAVLLGRAFDADRSVLAGLHDSDRVSIIEVPAPEWIEPIFDVIRSHVVGVGRAIGSSEFKHDTDRIVAPGTVALFRERPDAKFKSTEDDDRPVERAVQRRCAIVAVASDPERSLPPALLRLADCKLVVPPLDADAVAAVIEAVTARWPDGIDKDVAARVTLADLKLAIRADLGAEGSYARLVRIVNATAQSRPDAPLLSEMHGLGPAKDWGLRLATDLKTYAAGQLSWAQVDRGCLLTGAPGTGKTSFARALAREAGVHFIATSYSQWQAFKEGHLGHVTQALRNVFKDALQHRPTILFIDEIDTIPARGSTSRSDDWWTAITNTLLECLDGYEKREGVVVIAACNDPSRLDPALVRSGRLDRHIAIPLPDVPALVGIFRSHLGQDLADADLRPAALAARGWTGADVERFVREARSCARREGRAMTLAHLLDAVRAGEPGLPADVRRRVASHEAGHAVAMVALGLRQPVALFIGSDGGLAQSQSTELHVHTREHLEQRLVVHLAGRAAEELIHGEATAGAGGSEESDLGRATALAIRLETAFGLGQSGLVMLPVEGTRDLAFHSEVHEAVRATLEAAHARAGELLAANRAALEALAEALFKVGYLDRAEIDAVLAETPLALRAGTTSRPLEPTDSAPAYNTSAKTAPRDKHGPVAVAATATHSPS